MPVHFRRGLDFENCDFYRVSKIEDNFKCHFSACYGLFSLFTFEIKRNWLRVIGTLSRLRDLNRGSEWDFGSEKGIILIGFFFFG